MHALTEKILNARVRPEHHTSFLHPEYDSHVHSPFLLPDIKKASARIIKAIKKNERIAVYADFDCDGIPGAVILHDFFKKVGHDALEIYIPHRHNEGYGFHKDAIDLLHKREVNLIITVDVGSLAYESVAYAESLGIDVIVTDHHEIGEQTLSATAFINPKRKDSTEEYPFPDLCGAGVAFKLVQATLALGREKKLASCIAIPEGWEKWLLDMVGIATVADMVPLVGENRVLARYGIVVLQKTQRPGIKALTKKARIDQKAISEEDISFSFAPRINAASRMGEPLLAFTLLTTRDQSDADAIATTLEKLNAQRKGVVASVVKEARHKVSERYEGKTVAVVGSPDWQPSLLGLAANSVLEGRKGVVCLWGRDGKGVLKGSCRSDGSVHITNMFQRAGVVLDEAGGHAQAGGFSVSQEHIHSLQLSFEEAALSLEPGVEMSVNEVYETTPEELTFEFYKDLRKLSPFGVGNEKPTFMLKRVAVREVKIFGKTSNHTEVLFSSEGSDVVMRGFQFFKTPDEFSCIPVPGEIVTVLGSFERDQYKRSCVVRIVDIQRCVLK